MVAARVNMVTERPREPGAPLLTGFLLLPILTKEGEGNPGPGRGNLPAAGTEYLAEDGLHLWSAMVLQV